MGIRHYLSVFVLFSIFVACESNPTTDKAIYKIEEIKIDSSKLSYVSSVYEKAPTLFKKNCAECHCALASNCDSPNALRLKEYFKNVSDKSLLAVLETLKDSTALESKDYKENQYKHNLGKKITDEQLKIIIEYLRIESKK